ncbi:hypothetical protein RND81_11G193300 [Saponaria officinalis]|uniref:GRF-type domain-containing protein n=1 Tax=Saponaria officinalis TaxID=3572 RepID=A0AAW1HP91_SAPOF
MSKSYSSGSNHNTIKCRCGVPVATLRSWTEDNPGRRFLGCKFSNPDFSRGCGYFSWYDEGQVEWQKNTINQLMLVKKIMQCELAMTKTEVTHLQEQNEKLKEANLLIRQMKPSVDENVDEVNHGTNRKSCKNTFAIVVVVCLLVLIFSIVLKV